MIRVHVEVAKSIRSVMELDKITVCSTVLIFHLFVTEKVEPKGSGAVLVACNTIVRLATHRKLVASLLKQCGAPTGARKTKSCYGVL